MTCFHGNEAKKNQQNGHGGFENLSFFESAILKFIFASFPWKVVKVYWFSRMGQNFDQAKHDDTFDPCQTFDGECMCN